MRVLSCDDFEDEVRLGEFESAGKTDVASVFHALHFVLVEVGGLPTLWARKDWRHLV